MAFPRIPRRWRLRTLMIVVATCAVGLFVYREYVERGLCYQMSRLRAGHARARADAAFGLGLMGPRAAIAVGGLTAALDDPDPNVRTVAAYSLVRLGSRSPRLLPILVAEIEHTPTPQGGFGPELPLTMLFKDPPRGWPLSEGNLHKNDPVAALMIVQPDTALVVPMLGNALKDPNDSVRRAARDALFAVASWSGPSSPELADALLDVLADYRYDPLHHPIKVDDQFVTHRRAVEALAKQDRATQARAVAQIGRRPPRPGLAALVRGGAALAPARGRDAGRRGGLAGPRPRQRRDQAGHRAEPVAGLRGAGRAAAPALMQVIAASGTPIGRSSCFSA